jgi:hypothetical protein
MRLASFLCKSIQSELITGQSRIWGRAGSRLLTRFLNYLLSCYTRKQYSKHLFPPLLQSRSRLRSSHKLALALSNSVGSNTMGRICYKLVWKERTLSPLSKVRCSLLSELGNSCIQLLKQDFEQWMSHTNEGCMYLFEHRWLSIRWAREGLSHLNYPRKE